MKNHSDLRTVTRQNGTKYTMFRFCRRWFKIPQVVLVPVPKGPIAARTED